MDKGRDLSAQIKQLDSNEMELLRLKYGEGKNYKEIGAQLKLSSAEVGTRLFRTLKKLEADGAASLSEAERAKILGFIHGELDQSELQNMATRIESEEGLRKEFEAWLAVSDQLENLLAKPHTKPNPLAFTKRNPKQFWIAVGAVLLISVALPLMKKSDLPDVASTEAPSPVAPPQADQTRSDNTSSQTEQTDIPPPQPPTDAQFAEGAATESAAAPQTDVPATPPPAVAPASTSKKMGVFASKVKVSKNLNSKKVLHALQQRLDGKPSCVPAKMAKLKSVDVKIKLNNKGGISNIEPKPKNKALTKCLYALLGDKVPAFKPTKKGPTFIALSLKNY